MPIAVIALIVIIFIVLVSSAMWIQWSWLSCLWFTVPYWHCMRYCCGSFRMIPGVFRAEIGSTLQMQSWCWPQNASENAQNALRPFKIPSAVKYSPKGQKSITEACRASFKRDWLMTTLRMGMQQRIRVCRIQNFKSFQHQRIRVCHKTNFVNVCRKNPLNFLQKVYHGKTYKASKDQGDNHQADGVWVAVSWCQVFDPVAALRSPPEGDPVCVHEDAPGAGDVKIWFVENSQ